MQDEKGFTFSFEHNEITTAFESNGKVGLHASNEWLEGQSTSLA